MSIDEEALEAYSDARARLVIRKESMYVFFATLAFRLGCEVRREGNPTACTDGRKIYINPEFWMGLTDDERVGVVAHEVMHPALMHHTRRMGRDPMKWNIAADGAINQILKESGLTLPSDCVLPGKPPLSKAAPGLSAEEYYELIDKDYEKQKSYTLIGDVMDGFGDESERSRSEAEWKVSVAAAHEQAKRRGDVPGWLEKVVQAILEPQVDWTAELADFLKAMAKNDYRWSPPNRRFVWQGMYLPSLGGETIGDVVFFVDTSGSCWDDDTLSRFAAECQGVFDAYDCKIHIVYADCDIQRVDEWEPGDGDLELRVAGGGGTSHVKCWEWLKEQEFEPACVICLTDGWTEFGEDPGFPLLWALTDENVRPPFGKSLYIKQGK